MRGITQPGIFLLSQWNCKLYRFKECLATNKRQGRDETALFDDFRQRTESWEVRDNGDRQKKIKQTTPRHSNTAKTESSSEVSIQASPNDEIRDAIKRT